MTREEKFYEMVASSESSIQRFNDFFDDKAIVWAAHKIKSLDARVKALEEALREIRSAAIRGIHGDFLDVNVVGIANKALEATCQK